MVTCQSANQLKTPAKLSWAFKMVSQFGSLDYTIMGKTADLTVSRRQSLTPFTRRVSHKHSLPKKRAVHRVLYPSMLTESWVEGQSVEEKDAQPTERSAAFWMNEWMMHLYSTLLCIVVHPKCFTIIWGGGSLLNHHQSFWGLSSKIDSRIWILNFV